MSMRTPKLSRKLLSILSLPPLLQLLLSNAQLCSHYFCCCFPTSTNTDLQICSPCVAHCVLSMRTPKLSRKLGAVFSALHNWFCPDSKTGRLLFFQQQPTSNTAHQPPACSLILKVCLVHLHATTALLICCNYWSSGLCSLSNEFAPF